MPLELIQSIAVTGAAMVVLGLGLAQARPLTKPIPSSGEALPLVGLGSWITFNVGNDPLARDSCAQVMGAFFDEGGRMIDSSPMYGSAQDAIGYGLKKTGNSNVFATDKVWVADGDDGPEQIAESRAKWASSALTCYKFTTCSPGKRISTRFTP
jgi:diketogulonate reductase-like aldo/keto reductase